jgi:FixJ family two-component response regulator
VIEYTAADPSSAPDRLAAVRQACRRIERMPEPCPTVAAMAAGGADCDEIAAALGVSVSRVSQHRATIRKVLERYI